MTNRPIKDNRHLRTISFGPVSTIVRLPLSYPSYQGHVDSNVLIPTVGVSRISMSDAARLANRAVPIADDPDHYAVTLDVFHELHCLVSGTLIIDLGLIRPLLPPLRLSPPQTAITYLSSIFTYIHIIEQDPPLSLRPRVLQRF